MEFLKNLKRYLHTNLVWFSRVFSFWGVTLPLVLLFFITFLSWRLDSLVRYAGLVLELLGIITVAIGLKGKRELFKKPSSFEHIKNWWNQRPRWNPVTHTISVSGIAHSFSGGNAKISVWHGSKDATVESRLESFEKNLLSVRNEMQTIELDANNKHNKLIGDIENERKKREASFQEVGKRLENLVARDISFEALGVYWLFCGLVFSSLSSEISALLNLL